MSHTHCCVQCIRISIKTRPLNDNVILFDNLILNIMCIMHMFSLKKNLAATVVYFKRFIIKNKQTNK